MRSACPRLPLVLLLLAASSQLVSSDPSSRTIEPEWQVFLGPTKPRLVQQMSVCHDGSVYFVDALGRLVWIDASGRIRTDVQRSELIDMQAIACDDRGSLYAAVASNPPRLVILRPASGEKSVPTFDVIGACELERQPDVIATGDGAVYLLTTPSGSGGAGGFIQQLAEGCHTERAFGIAPDLPQADVARAVSRGALFWSRKREGLVFMPSFPYEAHVYERNGARRHVLHRGDPEFRHPDSGRGNPQPGDEVLRAAELPSGDIVTFVGRQREHRSETYIELLGGDLQPKARFTARENPGLGVFHGASGDGALYFGKGTRSDGVFITRARLRAAGQ